MDSRSECVELYCKVLAESKLAIKCDFGDQQEWIPKSRIHEDSEVWKADQEGELVIPLWLAEEKGLV